MTALIKYLRVDMKGVQKKKNKKKRIYHGCEGYIEKSVPRDHSLASLVMSDSNPRDGSFYLPLTPMIDSYIPIFLHTDKDFRKFHRY